MARRAKTKVGGGPRAETQLQAASRGRQSQEIAEAQQLQQIQQGGDRTAAAVSGAAGKIQQARQFKRQEEAQGKELEFRKQAETGRQIQTQRGQELGEATQGFEREPGGVQPPLVQDERMKQLQAGMDQGLDASQPGAAPPGAAPEAFPGTPEEQQRLATAGEAPVEIGGQGAATPGVQEPQGRGTRPGGLKLSQAGERRETRADYEAQTRRMEAQARIAGIQDKVLRSEFSGDKEGRKIIQDQMIAGLDQQMGVLSRVQTGKTNANDFKTLTKWADEMGMGEGADGGQLMDILKQSSSTGMGPLDPAGQQRLQGFITAYMDRSSMVYAATFGEIPGKFVDMAGPVWGQYMDAQKQITGLMQILGPQFQNYMGINTYEDKIRYQNRWAAFQVLAGKAGGGEEEPGGIAGAPAGGGAPPEGTPPPPDLGEPLQSASQQQEASEPPFEETFRREKWRMSRSGTKTYGRD